MQVPVNDSLPPTTTLQEDLRTLGQRRVNIIWELTQAILAIIVTMAIIYLALTDRHSEILNNAFMAILTLYFVRTNHTKIGGPGGTDSR